MREGAQSESDKGLLPIGVGEKAWILNQCPYNWSTLSSAAGRRLLNKGPLEPRRQPFLLLRVFSTLSLEGRLPGFAGFCLQQSVRSPTVFEAIAAQEITLVYEKGQFMWEKYGLLWVENPWLLPCPFLFIQLCCKHGYPSYGYLSQFLFLSTGWEINHPYGSLTCFHQCLFEVR